MNDVARRMDDGMQRAIRVYGYIRRGRKRVRGIIRLRAECDGMGFDRVMVGPLDSLPGVNGYGPFDEAEQRASLIAAWSGRSLSHAGNNPVLTRSIARDTAGRSVLHVRSIGRAVSRRKNTDRDVLHVLAAGITIHVHIHAL